MVGRRTLYAHGYALVPSIVSEGYLLHQGRDHTAPGSWVSSHSSLHEARGAAERESAAGTHAPVVASGVPVPTEGGRGM